MFLWASCFSIVSLGFLLVIGLTAERLLRVRRPTVGVLEEGDGEIGFEARASDANVSVAGLNQLAISPVVPRCVLTEQNTELPELERHLRLSEGESNQFQLVHGLEQALELLLIKEHALAHSDAALRAERIRCVGAPVGVALAARDERMSDSLVGLGLFRRHLRSREGVGLGVLASASASRVVEFQIAVVFLPLVVGHLVVAAGLECLCLVSL